MPSKRTPERIAYEHAWRKRQRAAFVARGLTVKGTIRTGQHRLDPAEKKRRRALTDAKRWASTPHVYRHRVYRSKAVPFEPIPMSYVGHEVFEAAREAAGIRADYQSDWGQNDILGEAVLAILEGRDPQKAVRKVRGEMWAANRLRAWKVIDYGADPDGNIITVKEYDD